MGVSETSLREQAVQAAAEVLETMFFEVLSAMPDACEEPAPDQPRAIVKFSGTLEGVYAVAIEAAPLRRMTASFLGLEEEEVTSELERNVLCEMTNMMCGATLSSLNPNGRIVISSPKVPSDPEVYNGPWVRFPLECGSLAISLSYRGL